MFHKKKKTKPNINRIFIQNRVILIANIILTLSYFWDGKKNSIRFYFLSIERKYQTKSMRSSQLVNYICIFQTKNLTQLTCKIQGSQIRTWET
jgi:hypothetical protein